jgi:sulfatase maturation enzyme AslB (radical SAM superfamily)
VTWSGGEPLVGGKTLGALAEIFIAGCDRYKVNYEASIITDRFFVD